jgi:hypothetical protein
VILEQNSYIGRDAWQKQIYRALHAAEILTSSASFIARSASAWNKSQINPAVTHTRPDLDLQRQYEIFGMDRQVGEQNIGTAEEDDAWLRSDNGK